MATSTSIATKGRSMKWLAAVAFAGTLFAGAAEAGQVVGTVTDVSGNNGQNPSADKGTTFTCDVTVNGAQRHVTVVVSDDNGTYEIDGPR